MTQPMEGELMEVMTVATVATMLRCTTQTVLNLQHRGLLEGGWMLGARYVTLASVERYLARREETHHEVEEKVSA